MLERSTVEVIYALRRLIERFGEKKRDLHWYFIVLEEVHDRIPRDVT